MDSLWRAKNVLVWTLIFWLFWPFDLLKAAPAINLESTASWLSDDDYQVGGAGLGDANHDGLLDLTFVNYKGQSYPPPDPKNVVFFGTGTAMATAAGWTSTDTNDSVDMLWLLFTDDEYPDLLSINGGFTYPSSGIYFGSGLGLAHTLDWVAEIGINAYSLKGACGDVNQDGKPDVFISNQCITPIGSPPCEVQVYGYISQTENTAQSPNWYSDNVGKFDGMTLSDLDRSHTRMTKATFVGNGLRKVFWLHGVPVRLLRVLIDKDPAGPLTYDRDAGYVELASPPFEGEEVEILYESSTAVDLAVGGKPGLISIYENSGNTIPTTPSSQFGYAEDSYTFLRFVDIDLDGYDDLVAGRVINDSFTNGSIGVYPNVNGSILPTPIWEPLGATIDVQQAAVADFNGDGFFDIVIVEGTKVWIYVNHEGTLEDEPSFVIPSTGTPIASIVGGDINGDALSDLVLTKTFHSSEGYVNLGSFLAAPAITSASPNTFEVGQSGEININGTNFKNRSLVFVGDVLLNQVTVTSDTYISANMPESLDEGIYDLFVVNPNLLAAKSLGAVTIGVPSNTDNEPDNPKDNGCSCKQQPIDILFLLWLIAGIVTHMRWRKRRAVPR